MLLLNREDIDRKLVFRSLEDAKNELRNLAAAKNISHNEQWKLNEIFNHMAQSIEYSMNGYPEMKSGIFRKTIGSITFSQFKKKGIMNHNTNSPIPGAPSISEPTPQDQAFHRLLNAILAFQNFEGELKTHFVFGKLTKKDYEIAHAMHIANHLSKIKLNA